MTFNTIAKWFGVLVLVAGIIRMGMTPAALIWGTDSTPELIIGFTACILMAVCSIGLFLVQRESGKIGLISSLLLMLFNAVTACFVWFLLALNMTAEEIQGQGLGENEFVMVSRILMMIGMFIGTPLFTYATYRAKVFPRSVFYLLLLSIFGPMIPGLGEWGALFWGLSYVGMGYVMITGKFAKSQTINETIAV
ncbi:hypothetical protein IM538_07220 [Cytobacillus suaedae]|nr:hypothetical protein IM538_07220 [Cytobacillus suaedae]